MRPELSFRLAYRHLRARARQMALSVVAVGLGVALVVGIQLMNRAVLDSFLDTADALAGRAALTVSAGPGLFFPETTAAQVAKVPGVALAVPLVRAVAFPDDGSGELLTVHGVDLANDAAVRLYHSTKQGESVVDDLVEFLNSPDSIVLGEAFARRRGLKIGDAVPLVTPHGVSTFTLRALLEPQGLARTLGGRLVVMDLMAAERSFAADGQISQIDIVLAPGAKLDAVRTAIAAVLPAGLTAEEPALRKSVIRKTIGGFQFMIAAFGVLAVFAGFVICYSRLNAIFEARTWQVGLLRAVGLSRAVVFGELLKESLILGVLGTALGIALGALIGRVGLPMLAKSTALAFRMPVPEPQAPALGLDAILTGVLVGVGAAIAAAVVPAIRLARKQPVSALRMRGREMPPVGVRMSWIVRSVTVGVLIVASMSAQIYWRESAFGHLTTALLALVILISAAPAVSIGGRALGAVWGRFFGPTGRFAARHVEWQPRRSALTVATIGLGFGAVLLFSILGWSFERTLVTRLDERIRSDLVVSSGLFSGGYREAPLNEDIMGVLSTLPGVRSVTGEQQTDIEYNDGEVVLLNSYDKRCFSESSVCDWRLSPKETQHLPDVAAGRAVLVSSSFAHHQGIAAGDKLTLTTPSGMLSLDVAGVTPGQSMDAIIMDRSLYARAWNDPLLYLIHVSTDDSASEKTAAEIRMKYGSSHHLLVRSRDDLVAYFGDQAHQAFSLLYLMEGMIFLLVAVAIGDTLAAGVAERSRKFAALRALGLDRRGLFSLVMLEGATIGLLGLALALVAGVALGIFWVTIQFPAILGWKLDVHVPYLFAFGAAVLTLLLCLTGSLIPSFRAARLVVARALRNE